MDEFLKNLNDSLANLPFWIGLFSVAAFAYSRFAVSLPDVDELSPPLQPRSFTTAFRFWHAACTYFGIYALVYLALLVIGTIPTLRQFLGSALVLPAGSSSNATVGTPAWAALVATAVLPAMPVVSAIDERLRGILQDFASIPTKARMLGRDVLALVRPIEPAPWDDTTKIEGVVAAIKAHKERSERIFEVFSMLSDDSVVAIGVSRRYDKFFRANQKMIEGFKQDFTATPEGYATLEAARSVERKYRVGVRKIARFLMCAILQAETTEFAARGRLRALGLDVPLMGIEFRPGLIVLSFAAIFATTWVGSYLSACLFFVIERPAGQTFFGLLGSETPTFFLWSLSTVLLYTLPLVFAAGATMYVLDLKQTATESDPTTAATSVVLTFLGSAGVALFILLPTTFLTQKIQADPRVIKFWEIVPWVIPPAVIATTFMYLSSTWKLGLAWISDNRAYILFHALAATVAATIAYLLWRAVGGSFATGVPERLPLYLVPITSAAIGGGIGWVLAKVRRANPAG
jgi:hypothetical protein